MYSYITGREKAGSSPAIQRAQALGSSAAGPSCFAQVLSGTIPNPSGTGKIEGYKHIKGDNRETEVDGRVAA